MSKRLRLLIILVLVVIMGFFIWPTINWYFILPDATKELASGSRTEIRADAQKKAELAVKELKDLVVSNPTATVPEKYNFVVEAAKKAFQTREEAKALQSPAPAKSPEPNPWTVRDVVSNFESADALQKVIETRFRDDILAIKDQRSGIIQLGLDLSGGMSVVLQATPPEGRTLNSTEYSEAMDLAIEVLRSRVDAFGVSEPSIRKDEGANRILLEIPGEPDRDAANRFLMGGSSLALQIVDQEATDALIQHQANYKSQTGLSWEPGADDVSAIVPAGEAVRALVKKDEYGIEYTSHYMVTKEDSAAKVDGTYITGASVTTDQMTNQPNATFEMNAEGGEKFRVLTRDNTGKSMAIVLDGKVRAYATINGEIPNGQVRITGLSRDEANDISKVLKVGALPLDLKIESMSEVGASLGQDQIKAGTMATAIGFGAVVLFMILYYLGSGFIADIALFLNVYIMLAILAVFNLTLTLTAIAGLILTVGISVDANVLIFERMKEELRAGKSRAAAIAAGYKKAFWTIVDSHVTQLIASILLAFLGTGPIQGFAVTLTVGIATSLFTALFVTHLIQDFGTEQLKRTKLSIAWRLK